MQFIVRLKHKEKQEQGMVHGEKTAIQTRQEVGGTKLPLCMWRAFRRICAKIRKESGPSESLFK